MFQGNITQKKQYYILNPSKKAFQSYNWILTSFPAWGLAVVLLWTGPGDSRIRVSLSNHGGPIESSKVT
jgi:hypothetical protein